MESYVHSPAKLLKAAELERTFQIAAAIDPVLTASWSLVVNWSEASRYQIMSRQDADQMIKAVAARKGGVLHGFGNTGSQRNSTWPASGGAA
jgi:hypothetical protein